MEFLRIAKLLALSVVCCISMAACSKSDEEPKQEPATDSDPYYLLDMVAASYSVIPNADLLEVADITCVATNFKGETKSYKLGKNNEIEINYTEEQPSDSDKWASSATRAAWINLPVGSSIEVNLTPKQGFTPDPERTYDLSLRVDGVMVASNSFGNEFGRESSLNTFEQSFPAGEGIAEWFKQTMPCKFGFRCEFVNGTFKVVKTK